MEPPTSTTDSRADLNATLRAAIAATERRDYNAAIRAFHFLYGTKRQDMPVDGLSFYGLCLERVEKKAKRAIELCQEAMEQQPYDPRHRANLIQVYLNLGSRKRAVELLEAGLKQSPKEEVLLRMQNKLRTRRPPVLPGLDRNHSLNVWLGKMRDRPGVMKALVAVVFLVVVIGITLLVLMH